VGTEPRPCIRLQAVPCPGKLRGEFLSQHAASILELAAISSHNTTGHSATED